MTQQRTLNQEEVEQFSKLASQWWDESGPFSPLHRLNPIRIQFITDTILQHLGGRNHHHPLKNLKILDIGCGGGLVAEPLTRLGGIVTGVDPSSKNIEAAQEHSKRMGLNITYQVGSIEDISPTSFDVIIGLEVLEHIENISFFLGCCKKLLDPKGILILSTLNRTVSSFLGGIIAAEYLLKWLPKGTHHWDKFVKPAELEHFLQKTSFTLIDLQGMGFSLLKQQWELQSKININYFAVAVPHKKDH